MMGNGLLGVNNDGVGAMTTSTTTTGGDNQTTTTKRELRGERDPPAGVGERGGTCSSASEAVPLLAQFWLVILPITT